MRGLCIKSRDIFINQPILLELEAPIKICGNLSQFLSKNWSIVSLGKEEAVINRFDMRDEDDDEPE